MIYNIMIYKDGKDLPIEQDVADSCESEGSGNLPRLPYQGPRTSGGVSTILQSQSDRLEWTHGMVSILSETR